MKNNLPVAIVTFVIILLGAAIVTAQVSGEFRTADPVSIALDKAYENYQKGEVDLALEQINMVIAKENLNPRAWFYLGLCDYQKKDYQTAFQNIEKAIRIYPEALNQSYDIRVNNYSLAKAKEREYKEELRELEATLAVTQSCRSRPLRNRINFVQNKLAELQLLEEPKRTEKIPADYYFHLGNCLLKLNQINYAHDAYQMALVSDPNHGDAHHNLAIINFMVKRYKIAKEHLEKAKALGAKINQDFEVQLTASLK